MKTQKDDEEDLGDEEGESIVPEKATPKCEEGEKATPNELKEVNLGSYEVLWPIFISGTPKKKNNTSNS